MKRSSGLFHSDHGQPASLAIDVISGIESIEKTGLSGSRMTTVTRDITR